MDRLIQAVTNYITKFDWNSPEAFGAFAIIAAVVFKRWVILATVVAIMVIGANIEKYYTIQIEFNNFTVTSPFIVYATGMIIVFFMAFLSLFNR